MNFPLYKISKRWKNLIFLFIRSWFIFYCAIIHVHQIEFYCRRSWKGEGNFKCHLKCIRNYCLWYWNAYGFVIFYFLYCNPQTKYKFYIKSYLKGRSFFMKLSYSNEKLFIFYDWLIFKNEMRAIKYFITDLWKRSFICLTNTNNNNTYIIEEGRMSKTFYVEITFCYTRRWSGWW